LIFVKLGVSQLPLLVAVQLIVDFEEVVEMMLAVVVVVVVVVLKYLP
jgi:hypothetical protein